MRLIVIDPHVVSRSPSMRGWIGALPSFRNLFDEIEIWASECELGPQDGVIWHKIPQRLPTWHLHALDFQYQVNQRLKHTPNSADTLVQVTGCLAERADIRYMHFWNCALLEERAKRSKNLRLNSIHRLGTEWAAYTERKIAADPNATKWWWVVSESIRDRIAAQSAGGKFRVLPNQYDADRFNEGTRNQWRDRMRIHYGIEKNEKLLVFSAFGSFERKGLFQAIECLKLLRHKDHSVKLLILGGNPSTLSACKKKMKTMSLTEDGCIFAGLVNPIEQHLSAGDALFFPSHFEAFSLAEIEAAALGLRLYLTPHYGSEMILRDPTNGRLLPWEPQGMANVIAEDIDNGILGQSHTEMGDAINQEQYGIRLRELYQQAISSKSSR